MNNNLFNIDPTNLKNWKSKKHFMCQCAMPLWIGLHRAVERKDFNSEREKEVIKAYPKDTNNCRCRNCRYKRIFGK